MSNEREQIVEFILREARERYGAYGNSAMEEALQRIAQLIERGEHCSIQ